MTWHRQTSKNFRFFFFHFFRLAGFPSYYQLFAWTGDGVGVVQTGCPNCHIIYEYSSFIAVIYSWNLSFLICAPSLSVGFLIMTVLNGSVFEELEGCRWVHVFRAELKTLVEKRVPRAYPARHLTERVNSSFTENTVEKIWRRACINNKLMNDENFQKTSSFHDIESRYSRRVR